MVSETSKNYYSKSESKEILFNLLSSQFDKSSNFSIRYDFETDAGVVDYLVYNKTTELPHLIAIAEEGSGISDQVDQETLERLFGIAASCNRSLNELHGKNLNLSIFVAIGPIVSTSSFKKIKHINVTLEAQPVYEPSYEETHTIEYDERLITSTKAGKKPSTYEEESEDDVEVEIEIKEDDDNDDDDNDDDNIEVEDEEDEDANGEEEEQEEEEEEEHEGEEGDYKE